MLAKAEKMSEDMLEYDEMYFKVYKLSLIQNCMYCIDISTKNMYLFEVAIA